MSTKKRGESPAARARKQAAREAAARKRKRLGVAIGASLLVVALVSVFFVTQDEDDASDVSSDAPTTSAPTGEPAAFQYGSGPCPPAEKPAQRPTSFADAPMRCIEDGVDYSAEIVTSEGAFTVDLLEDVAPGTVNNFVVLARSGWFDGDDFHRVVKGFVNQAGDPVGNPPGTGGPGYAIADELPASVADYVEGAVAMANSGPNTNGSQWFVCVDCSGLPTAGYSLFGQVTAGLDVVRRINDLGQPDQTPSRPVAITSVEIREG